MDVSDATRIVVNQAAKAARTSPSSAVALVLDDARAQVLAAKHLDLVADGLLKVAVRAAAGGDRTVRSAAAFDATAQPARDAVLAIELMSGHGPSIAFTKGAADAIVAARLLTRHGADVPIRAIEDAFMNVRADAHMLRHLGLETAAGMLPGRRETLQAAANQELGARTEAAGAALPVNWLDELESALPIGDVASAFELEWLSMAAGVASKPT